MKRRVSCAETQSIRPVKHRVSDLWNTGYQTYDTQSLKGWNTQSQAYDTHRFRLWDAPLQYMER